MHSLYRKFVLTFDRHVRGWLVCPAKCNEDQKSQAKFRNVTYLQSFAPINVAAINDTAESESLADSKSSPE